MRHGHLLTRRSTFHAPEWTHLPQSTPAGGLLEAVNLRIGNKPRYLAADPHPSCTRGTCCAGGLPEAVNLWIGDERSVTSWHKDPFENIYAVRTVCLPCLLRWPGHALRAG